MWWKNSVGMALAMLGLVVSTVAAEPMQERLVLSLPDGWDIGNFSVEGDMKMTEWIPDGQSVENWTERITLQVFRGVGDMTVQGFAHRILVNSEWVCARTTKQIDEQETDGPYPVLTLTLACDTDNQHNHIRYKFIEGNDNFYVVQRAWRGEADDSERPDRSQTTDRSWTKFLDGVHVHDRGASLLRDGVARLP